MTTEGRGSPATHVVSCYHCKALFDALAVEWCQCLVSRRSLLCPGCHQCFCRASQAYKQGFWESASPELWDRVAAEHASGQGLPANPPVDGIPHPLILIVDDEKDILRIAFATISRLGYQVITASGGEEGIGAARAYKPDLILTDAFMPKMDGREMCRRIKSDPETAGAKVVVMTSLYTASRYKYEAFKEFQADDYLAKPLELQALDDLLRKHVGPGSGGAREP